MSTVTLRPNATILAPDSVFPIGTADSVSSDDDDFSYFSDDDNTIVGMETVAMAAGSITKAAQIRWRGESGGGAGAAFIYLRTPTDIFMTWSGPLPPSLSTVASGYSPVTMTQAQVDAAALWVYTSPVAPIDVYELWWDLVYVEQPVVALTAVSPDPFQDSNYVPLAWVTTLDGDGGWQTHYQYRIFDDTTYTLGSVDPDTDVAFLDSGVVLSGFTNATTSVLPNDQYRVFLRVAQTVNGVLHWSGWDDDTFTVDVETSDVDTVVAVAVDSQGAIEVTATRDAASEAWDFLEVERTVDNGSSWSPVRGATYVEPIDADEVEFIDYEVPNGVDVRYRARATRIVSGLAITGDWTESTPAVAWESNDCWLKAPGAPELNTVVKLRQAPIEEYERRAGVFEILAAPGETQGNRVVVSGAVQQGRGTLTIHCRTDQQLADVRRLLREAVLLLDPPPAWNVQIRYFAPIASSHDRLTRYALDPHRFVPVKYVEVSAPADPFAGSPGA